MSIEAMKLALECAVKKYAETGNNKEFQAAIKQSIEQVQKQEPDYNTTSDARLMEMLTDEEIINAVVYANLGKIESHMAIGIALVAIAAYEAKNGIEGQAQPSRSDIKQEPVARVVSHGATVKLEWASVEAAHNAKAGPLFSISPQRQPLTEWQPIETAPDETEVFIGAFIDGVFKFGRSVRFYEQGNEFEGETWSGWVWSIDDCSDSVAEMPTHWMPLPSAPIEAAHGIKGEA